MFNAEKFSKRLRELMTQSGDKNASLGRKIGVSGQCVGLWLAQKREPHISHVYAIAKLYDISAEYLTGLTDKF